MLTVREIRKKNLEILLKQYFEGSKSQICARMEMSPAQVSQLFSGYRNVGDSIARRFEVVCGLPHGWMDTLNSDETALLELFRSLESQKRKQAIEIIRLLAS